MGGEARGREMKYIKQVQLARRRYKDTKAVLDSLGPLLKQAGRRKRAAVKAQEIVQTFCQSMQEKTYSGISQLVTDCLQSVFPDPYVFKLEFDKKRGKAEARPIFLRAGEEFDPMNECGGGVIDVVAFALRLATLRPKAGELRQVLFLDEPFKHVSKNYSERLAKLLETLSKELGIQIIIITHNEDLANGKVIPIVPNPQSRPKRDTRTNSPSVPKTQSSIPPGPKSRRRDSRSKV